MFKRTLVLLLGLFLLTQGQAREIKGVVFPETLNYGQSDLLLNGVGIRSKLFFDIYAIGLYTPQKMTDASLVFNEMAPRRVVIKLLHKVEAESIFSSLMAGLAHNVSKMELENFKPYIDQMHTIFKQSGTLHKGDVIVLDMLNQGLQISIRGQESPLISSERFAQAVLAIWLGEHPVDKKLKHALLGESEV